MGWEQSIRRSSGMEVVVTKHVIKAVIGLASLSLLACGGSSSAVVRPSDSPEPRKAEERSSPYRNVSTATWEVGRGVQIEASLERLNRPLVDAPADLPAARLTIKNLAIGSVIHQQDSDDSPVSMYARDLGGVGRVIVLTWAGGSAERLEIIAVDAARARIILSESYRVSASFIDLEDDTTDVLITTGESGAGPFHTTRYVLRDGRYQPDGVSPHKSFVDAVKQQFAAPRHTSPRPPR